MPCFHEEKKILSSVVAATGHHLFNTYTSLTESFFQPEKKKN